jgi:CDP-diacylglycerol---glycerol-3-phosphate 3-phosphatidyltransferase
VVRDRVPVNRGAWARSLPNALTIARLAALPLLLVVLIQAPGPTSLSAGLIFSLVGATDFLDGYLARRLGVESTFGRIADPLADRLLVAVGLVGLVLLDRVHWAAPAILIARDVILIAGFVFAARRGVVMHVDAAGKLSSALTMFSTGACLLVAAGWAQGLLWLAVAVAVATFIQYIAEGARALQSQRRVSISG